MMSGAENDESEILKRMQRSPSASARNSDGDLQLNGHHEDAPNKRVRRRIQKFSDSDSDMERQQPNDNDKSVSEENTKVPQSSDSDRGRAIFKIIPHKSRIRKVKNESSSDSDSSKSDQVMQKSGFKDNSKIPPDSDSDSKTTSSKTIPLKSLIPRVKSTSSSDSDQAGKNDQQLTRMKNKRNKMKDKFKSLKTSREKVVLAEIESHKSANDSSEESDYEANSIEVIKQKIKERMSFKPSICDPDTSDEGTENRQHKSMPNQKKERRIKLTSPKPQRMSAKQAMENMQKIKSESNRMLREKEVSLPYHRPKALSLKDIMSRRKPAVSSDGKSLPIKMNGEQLKQYAQMLEERQKQMMELWQSDTDEENDDKVSDVKTDDIHSNDGTAVGATIDPVEPKQIKLDTIENEQQENAANLTENSDKLFDILSHSFVEETKINQSKENVTIFGVESTNKEEVTEEQDSETNMKLVFNDSETSITENKTDDIFHVIEKSNVQNNEASTVTNLIIEASSVSDKNNDLQDSESIKINTEVDSQIISLHYDTERLDSETLHTEDFPAKVITDVEPEKGKNTSSGIENLDGEIEAMEVDAFSDDDMNIEDIDNIIENAELIRDIENKVNSQVLIRDRPLNTKPTLTGAPGMVIELDDNSTAPKKSGVELLKERFTFFAKLKTPEEVERDNERRIKPGNQHWKLKQVLEEQMAEQRSLEWGKRLEDEKQHQKELKELRGEESDDENDIDKIEAKLQEENEGEESEIEEEELLEDDIEMKDKPKVKNPMLENEAEESDGDEHVKDDGNEDVDENEHDIYDGDDKKDGDENDEDDDSSESESSESEEEQPTTKKGRILKAFEDSDDEEISVKVTEKEIDETKSVGSVDLLGSQAISQDDVLTLAQRHKSVSEDLFTSQGSSLLASQKEAKSESRAVQDISANDVDLGTQTFSILDSTNNVTEEILNCSDKLSVICETQPYDDNLDAVAAMCSGSFSQSLPPLPITQISQSQPIGEDILALCTGKFYENEFISQVDNDNQLPLGASQEYDSDNDSPTVDKGQETQGNNVVCKGIETDNEHIVNSEVKETELNGTDFKVQESKKVLDDNLKSILDELDDPEFDTPKPNKFFCGAKTQKGTEDLHTGKEVESQSVKKKFIIDSDEDEINDVSVNETKKKKKLRKKREKRALQISDDEEEDIEQEEEEFESEIEEDNSERLVEYDSEENEIEVKPQNQRPLKKKRKASEFFEQEAELTSEDEWVGSGDEDEAGLDRMEREAGDDESFHQGRLQRELGQIHMRDVLDQDKREVRIIQELLFEDGDLGGGGRERKFKWRNLDGDEETGTGVDEFGDTQEEEFESEEQWRKQRHERETFLRQMQNNSEPDDSLNVSINRTTIIKANLMSKTMSMLLEENQPVAEKTDSPVLERKTATITSPKKPFSLLQQSYQGSILSRGKGALARLAALATPLAVDDDAPKGKSAASSSGRNFVFAALTPEAPKVTKRKAEANPSTPKLVKKMKTDEKQIISKSSLLDHMKV